MAVFKGWTDANDYVGFEPRYNAGSKIAKGTGKSNMISSTIEDRQAPPPFAARDSDQDFIAMLGDVDGYQRGGRQRSISFAARGSQNQRKRFGARPWPRQRFLP